VKFSDRVTAGDAAGIRFLQEVLPGLRGGAVIYTGHEIKRLFKGIYAVPFSMLAGIDGLPGLVYAPRKDIKSY